MAKVSAIDTLPEDIRLELAAGLEAANGTAEYPGVARPLPE